MTVMNIQWNNCGSVLAVAGMQRAAAQVNEQAISDNWINSEVKHDVYGKRQKWNFCHLSSAPCVQ